MLGSTIVFGGVLYALGMTSLNLVGGLSLEMAALLGFALSFSSTVFAVKALEDSGEMASTYGRTAVGILIMQDIAAVAFLVFAHGHLPPPSAVILFAALVPARWVLLKLMDRTGHEELLILFGLAVALGGAQVFTEFEIKGDLGALVLGFMLAGHRWSDRLAKALLGFKDLFLVGFFLSIGLKGIPGRESLGLAVVLLALLPVKAVMFFWLLVKFRLRARTAFHASLKLTNYSEFGLIVAALAAGNGWLSDQWLIAI